METMPGIYNIIGIQHSIAQHSIIMSIICRQASRISIQVMNMLMPNSRLHIDNIISGRQRMFRSITRISSIIIRMGIIRWWTGDVPQDLSIIAGTMVTGASDIIGGQDIDMAMFERIVS